MLNIVENHLFSCWAEGREPERVSCLGKQEKDSCDEVPLSTLPSPLPRGADLMQLRLFGTPLPTEVSLRPLLFPQREELKDLHTYCVYNNLPSGLRQEMLDFMQLKFRISEKRRDVLDKFPRPIRARVAKLLHRSYLEGADLFQDCSPEMLEQMVGAWFLNVTAKQYENAAVYWGSKFKAYCESLRVTCSRTARPRCSSRWWGFGFLMLPVPFAGAPNSRHTMKV
jgi:hypothetical protein